MPNPITTDIHSVENYLSSVTLENLPTLLYFRDLLSGKKHPYPYDLVKTGDKPRKTHTFQILILTFMNSGTICMH